MDELLIEDKKYVSSKRAAKMTGYAKDYVGQLCREGRVPARLVGRGWYVLESAIQDHRFGDPVATQEAPKKATESSPSYESPRYESSDVEALPSVNRLREKEPVKPVEDTNTATQHLQDTWQAWFDRFDHAAPVAPAPVEEVTEEIVDTTVPVSILVEKEPEPVPIRAIYHAPYQPQAREIAPPQREEDQEEEKEEDTYEVKRYEPAEGRTGKTTTMRAIQMSGVLLALVMCIAAALGSGYFDTYISSNNKGIGLFAGVSFYNR